MIHSLWDLFFVPVGLERSVRVRGASRALPVADKEEHKCVPGSIADAVDLSTRKISGTPNGQSDLSEWPRSADEEGAPTPTKMPSIATGYQQ